MKTVFIFFTILFFSFIVESQTISSEQENIIFNLAKETSQNIADKIHFELNKKSCTNCNVNIKIFQATDASGNVTDFGVYYTNFLKSSLQAKMNSTIIKKYNYNVILSTESGQINSEYNFDMNISYLMDEKNFIVSKTDLKSDMLNISIPSFKISEDINKVKTLNSIAQNADYDKIMTFEADNGLFEDFKIFDNDNNEIISKNNDFKLNLYKEYKFRVFLKTYTFLYIFYYEPHKSNFFILYPSLKQNNQKITFNIKDISKLSFNNTNSADLKIIVSDKMLKINEVIDNETNQISPEQAKIILMQLNMNKESLTTKNFKLSFE